MCLTSRLPSPGGGCVTSGSSLPRRPPPPHARCRTPPPSLARAGMRLRCALVLAALALLARTASGRPAATPNLQCGRRCLFNQVCVGGQCKCPPSTIMCKGYCLPWSFFQSNMRHCGGVRLPCSCMHWHARRRRRPWRSPAHHEHLPLLPPRHLQCNTRCAPREACSNGRCGRGPRWPCRGFEIMCHGRCVPISILPPSGCPE